MRSMAATAAAMHRLAWSMMWVQDADRAAGGTLRLFRTTVCAAVEEIWYSPEQGQRELHDDEEVEDVGAPGKPCQLIE